MPSFFSRMKNDSEPSLCSTFLCEFIKTITSFELVHSRIFLFFVSFRASLFLGPMPRLDCKGWDASRTKPTLEITRNNEKEC